jgi:hypothetical protein
MGLAALAGLKYAVGTGSKVAGAIGDELEKQKKLKAWKDVSDTVERLRQAKTMPETEPETTPTDNATPTPAKTKDLGLNVLEGNKVGADNSDTGSDFVEPKNIDITSKPENKPTESDKPVKPVDIKASAAKAISKPASNTLQDLMDEQSLWNEAIKQNPEGADHPAYKALQDQFKSAMGYGSLANKEAETKVKSDEAAAHIAQIQQKIEQARIQFPDEIKHLQATTDATEEEAAFLVSKRHFTDMQTKEMPGLYHSQEKKNNETALNVGEKSDQFMDKRFTSLSEALDPSKASSRSAMGSAAIAAQRAERLQSLAKAFPSGQLRAPEIVELATGLNQMIGGSIAVSQIQDLVPHSAIGNSNKFVEWLTNEPTGADQGKLVDRMLGSIDRESYTANQQIKRAQFARVASFKDLEAKDKNKFEDVLASQGVSPNEYHQWVSGGHQHIEAVKEPEAVEKPVIAPAPMVTPKAGSMSAEEFLKQDDIRRGKK